MDIETIIGTKIYIDTWIEILLNGDPSPVESPEMFITVNSMAAYFMEHNLTTDDEIDCLGSLLHLANIIYNNMNIDDDQLVLDNGVYDLLLEKYRCTGRKVQVGAEPVVFKREPKMVAAPKKNATELAYRMDLPENPIFVEDIHPYVTYKGWYDNRIPTQLVSYFGGPTGKKLRLSGHDYPELVGTLHKCKFVTDKSAEEAGVFDDPKVKVFERDFLQNIFNTGLLDRNSYFEMICELKYDGVSVVVHIVDRMVVKAVSRGDTAMDAAVDYTDVLYGYTFPNLPVGMELEVKCEAVMTYQDLYKFNQVRGYDYKNPRSAIVGIIGLNDGYKYRNFITLVPLKVVVANDPETAMFDVESMKMLIADRMDEVNFINDFLATKIEMTAVPVRGYYLTLLYEIDKFVKEAEAMRPYMNVMYDGVVVSFRDPYMVKALGRKDFVNLYQMAIKFPTLKRKTKLLGITYTVGQNGVITPMAHYQPIEFLGTVHTKSSISSVRRFNENQFKIGNTIQVEYINDVIPYVSTPQDCIAENEANPNPVLEFTSVCPACKMPLSFSEKTATCTNLQCKGRVIARMANMMDKLGIKGFAEETMAKLGVTSLKELCELSEDKIASLINSKVLAQQLVESLRALMSNKVYDYIIIGSLGFTNIAIDTWRKIFREYTLNELISSYSDDLYNKLINIKGIGSAIANSIISELPQYLEDIYTIMSWNIIIDSKGIMQKKIRITGCRDAELMTALCDMGYDASDKGVTKDTFILLVPNEGFSSSKVKKAGPDTRIIPIEEFKNNMEKYLV